MNNDQELERFKKIDLIAYALNKGYKINKAKTSRACTVLENGQYRIGIFKRSNDENWYLKNYTTDQGGTIIELAQNFSQGREKNMGEVRKELRAFAGIEKDIQSQHVYSTPQPATENRIDILTEFSTRKLLLNSAYLNSRGIKNSVLKSDRFYGNIFTDSFNNVCFPHWDEKGVSGFEKKNIKFTGFSSGGVRGVWFSKAKATDTCIAFFESGVDALSYFQLKDDGKTQYISIGGQLGEVQGRLIKKIIQKNPTKEIRLCFDHDDAGLKYINSIKIDNPNVAQLTTDVPNQFGNDWNDVLKGSVLERKTLTIS